MSFQKMYGLRGPSGLNMVNQAFIIVIAYGREEEGEGENTRDRSVPDGSDNNPHKKDSNICTTAEIFQSCIICGEGRSIRHSVLEFYS